MLHLIQMWLECSVEIRFDGNGRTRNWQRVDAVHLNPDRIENEDVAPQGPNQERKAARDLFVEATTSFYE
ncbi:hypothetical protein [Paraburkholderia xenovorans]|uniref:hypothetical protein n=1 Tax=Paraburkholderia xenovorans TaxID=36873 RepID=UPI0038B88BDE